MRPWQEVFTGDDRKLIEKAGMARKQEFGKRPALLVVDVTREFVGSKPLPVLQAAEEYPTACGEVGWATLPGTQKLLEACRGKAIPAIFTIGDFSAKRYSMGPVKTEPPRLNDPRANDIPDQITPLPAELVIPKVRASAFFGTPLLSCLRTMGTDSLIVVGGTTSGCVRATVVDAFCFGYRCFVVEECVFDRFHLSHLVNLFDINAKYADVITLEEALGLISRHC